MKLWLKCNILVKVCQMMMYSTVEVYRQWGVMGGSWQFLNIKTVSEWSWLWPWIISTGFSGYKLVTLSTNTLKYSRIFLLICSCFYDSLEQIFSVVTRCGTGWAVRVTSVLQLQLVTSTSLGTPSSVQAWHHHHTLASCHLSQTILEWNKRNRLNPDRIMLINSVIVRFRILKQVSC